MYQLEEPKYFYLLLLIPALLLLYSLYLAWRRRAQKSFGDKALLEQLIPEKSPTKPLLKLILHCLIIALVSLARSG